MTNPPAAASDIEQRMLEAQETLAGFAAWMFVLGVVSFIVSALGTVALIFQLKATRRSLELANAANEVSEKRMQLEMRPWVSVKTFDFHFGGTTVPEF